MDTEILTKHCYDILIISYMTTELFGLCMCYSLSCSIPIVVDKRGIKYMSFYFYIEIQIVGTH